MISKPASKTAPDASPVERQRLDKWLWFARIAKTRTLATRLAETGKARINRTRVSKASRMVRSGDVITLVIHEQVRVLKVLACGTRRGPASEARELYEDMSPPPLKREAARPPLSPGQRDKGAGRPTKRERRQMLSWLLNNKSSSR